MDSTLNLNTRYDDICPNSDDICSHSDIYSYSNNIYKKKKLFNKRDLCEDIVCLKKENYDINNINNINNVDSIKQKLCHQCYQKKKSQEMVSKIEIFNKINYIIFNSMSMPDVYNKIDNIILPFSKWLEPNEEGYTVFHWFAWFISTKIKKYQHIKPKVYAFFQKVFSDNTIDSIFTEKQIKIIQTIQFCTI